MKEIWIIGAGRFGLHALNILSKTLKNTHFVLVDQNGVTLPEAGGANCTAEHSQGPAFLERNLLKGTGPDWIIPAAPIHLAAEWALLRLGFDKLRRAIAPHEIDLVVPNAFRGATGDIYVSHADFMCPEGCTEPQSFCTATRKPRKQDMFEVLKQLDAPPFRPLVVRSHQLGPGVGGYRPEQLFELLVGIQKANRLLLVSTACRCHGVITALERIREVPISPSPADPYEVSLE